MPQLKVTQIEKEDVFADMARVHYKYRKNSKAGRIIKIKIGNKMVRAVARGAKNNNTETIAIDSEFRGRLGVKVDDVVNCEITDGNSVDAVFWGWNASDPTHRLATRLAVYSLLLGAIGLILGLISLA